MRLHPHKRRKINADGALASPKAGVILKYNTNLHDCTVEEVAVEAQAGRSSVAWHITLTSVVLFGSGAAFGATNSESGCDEISRDFQRLDVTLDALEVDAVDHMPVTNEVVDSQSLDTTETTEGAAAPVLYLTPRVATILREVFGTGVDEDPREEAAAAETPVAEDTEVDDPADAEAAEMTAPVTLIDQTEELPQFQRQMFRKDI